MSLAKTHRFRGLNHPELKLKKTFQQTRAAQLLDRISAADSYYQI